MERAMQRTMADTAFIATLERLQTDTALWNQFERIQADSLWARLQPPAGAIRRP